MITVCAVAAALLCLVPVSHSAPLACENLLRPPPPEQLDPRHLEGTWALVAGSLKTAPGVKPLILSDSTRIDYYNSTFTQASRFGDLCQYNSQNISIEGHNFSFVVGQTFNFTGTFLHTSCPDCVVLNVVMQSPHYDSLELYLFSRRREVDQEELKEFTTQVECLKMPKHSVVDPDKAFCPHTPSCRRQTEDKTQA